RLPSWYRRRIRYDSPQPRSPTANPTILRMWTIHQAAEQIRTRKLTPLDLLDQCLARVDQLESKVRAWVFVARDEAREQAEKLTKELDRGQYRGPLHGIPVGVKDIFDVFDWPTAAGSKVCANSVASRD